MGEVGGGEKNTFKKKRKKCVHQPKSSKSWAF